MRVFEVGPSGIGRVLVAAATLCGLTALAFAQAGGPDYFRIEGLKKEDSVNIRREPNTDAKIVGKIPKDADGIKNLGCKGGLTQKQWDKASEARKKAAARDRWCRVEYKEQTGWVTGRFLGEGTAPDAVALGAKKDEPKEQPKPETPAAPPPPAPVAAPAQTNKPSFDCSKADKIAEKFICGDAELAALDREIARLYALVSEELNAMPGFEGLLDSQRGWILQRNTCFDRDCVAEMQARRVHQFRQTYQAARAESPASISMGPQIVRCEGLPVPVGVTFVNSDPGFAVIEWADRSIVLSHVPSGSGARYEGSVASFHSKGDEAVLKLPGAQQDLTCKIERG